MAGLYPTEEELRTFVRQISNTAIDHEIVQELEKHQPGKIRDSSGETF